MNKRFIVLIDFSPYSANLIQHAGEWAMQAGAEIHLAHQTVALAPALADKESRDAIAQHTNAEALFRLKELARSILPPTIKTTFTVSENPIQITVAKLLAEPFDNLVFVGLKGTGLLKKIFIGSVAIQILDHINGIVVAMPHTINRFSHEKIFVAVTEKYPLNIIALNELLDFMHEGSTSITFFYLAKPEENNPEIEKQLQDLTKIFAEKYDTTYAIYEGKNAFEDIKKVINNKIEELLIVQKGSRLLTDRLFRKFLINDLVYEGNTPLIVLPGVAE